MDGVRSKCLDRALSMPEKGWGNAQDKQTYSAIRTECTLK